jgi:hypothetical protein
MTSGWRLFVDDLAEGDRNPRLTVDNPRWRTRAGLRPGFPNRPDLGVWVVAHNCKEAVAHVSRLGPPTFVSFDHDLADGLDGLWLARALIEADMDGSRLPDDFGYEVHSANPVGRENIHGLLSRYLELRNAGTGD